MLQNLKRGHSTQKDIGVAPLMAGQPPAVVVSLRSSLESPRQKGGVLLARASATDSSAPPLPVFLLFLRHGCPTLRVCSVATPIGSQFHCWVLAIRACPSPVLCAFVFVAQPRCHHQDPRLRCPARGVSSVFVSGDAYANLAAVLFLSLKMFVLP